MRSISCHGQNKSLQNTLASSVAPFTNCSRFKHRGQVPLLLYFRTVPVSKTEDRCLCCSISELFPFQTQRTGASVALFTNCSRFKHRRQVPLLLHLRTVPFSNTEDRCRCCSINELFPFQTQRTGVAVALLTNCSRFKHRQRTGASVAPFTNCSRFKHTERRERRLVCFAP